jgi:hypothetical protein
MPANKIKSLNMGGTVTDEHGNMTQFSLMYPSESCPDLESLLSHVIGFVNEEAGTEFTWMYREDVGKMLNATVDLMQAQKNSIGRIDELKPVPDPNRKARIEKNLKSLGYGRYEIQD